MRTIRIHVDVPLAVGHSVTLPPQAGEHVGRVLRMAVGDPLVLFNGDGSDYAATLSRVGKREVFAEVISAQPLATESPLRLTLAQGVARGEKMDLIIQKATELGVTRIVPLLTERAEVKLDPARARKRWTHWQAVIASACEQCGRARLPELLPAQPLRQWLGDLDGDDALRLALLPQAVQRITDLRFGAAGGILLVGPEGGLGERDMHQLDDHGFRGLNLGPRILRTETAGLAALAALQAIHGDG